MKPYLLSLILLAAAHTSLAGEGDKPSAELSWSRLPSLPNELGVGGPFVGVHNGVLIVAGGANFPRPVWENEKQWLDTIHVLTRHGDGYVWRNGGKLPRATAYGAAVSTPDGVVCLGGNDSKNTFSDVFVLRWDTKKKTISVANYPPLPRACAYTSATLVGNVIYLAGGQNGPSLKSAMNNFWALDLSDKDDPRKFAWKMLPPCPGPPRTLNLTIGQRSGGRDSVYVISGRREQGEQVQFLKDVWRYAPAAKKWTRRRDAPRCVMAGPGIGFGTDKLYILGGADGTLFSKSDELRDRHPGFIKQALVYDTVGDRWASAGAIPANHVTTVAAKWNGSIIIASGEVCPRVRSPKVWKINPAKAAR